MYARSLAPKQPHTADSDAGGVRVLSSGFHRRPHSCCGAGNIRHVACGGVVVALAHGHTGDGECVGSVSMTAGAHIVERFCA
jgi:hypothetical protein